MKRTNPRSRPATEADVLRARKQAAVDATRYAWAILFTVLCDKHGATPDELHVLWREVDELSDEVSSGRVTVPDLTATLKHDYGIILE